MEKIATDIYSFEKLRRGGYVYVDKTDLLWRLVSETDGSQFFIARPRRFGKSLMLSTLAAIFEGSRGLFKGLKIDKLDYDAYRGDRRPVTLVGVNFRAAKLNIDEPVFEDFV